MIANERQYKITRDRADRFQKALAEFDDRADADIHPILAEAQRDAMKSQVAALHNEIDEYERLRAKDQAEAPR